MSVLLAPSQPRCSDRRRAPCRHRAAQPAMPGMCRMSRDLTAGGQGAEQPRSSP